MQTINHNKVCDFRFTEAFIYYIKAHTCIFPREVVIYVHANRFLTRNIFSLVQCRTFLDMSYIIFKGYIFYAFMSLKKDQIVRKKKTILEN